MMKSIGIVDLFAGPGGLAEGFASFRDEDGHIPFKIDISIEKDTSAHSTLLLRTFLRNFKDGFPSEYYDFINKKSSKEPSWKTLYPEQWANALDEARCMELGKTDTTEFLNQRIEHIKNKYGGNTVVIGGPPCQAYSIVGRSRNAGIQSYVADQDHRHFLYKEYVNVLNKLQPAAFVMENVKGMLSSAIKGDRVFYKVMSDLINAAGEDSYQLYSLSHKGIKPFTENHPNPSDFIIKFEEYGIPQARHRVILIGLRRDVATALPEEFSFLLSSDLNTVRVGDVIGNMPKLRSGLSKKADAPDVWLQVVLSAMNTVKLSLEKISDGKGNEFVNILEKYTEELLSKNIPPRVGMGIDEEMVPTCPQALWDWLYDVNLTLLPNHETRGHMDSDLARYIFVAVFGEIFKRSPKAAEFPEALAPNHKNWDSGKFSDRFRVQLKDSPSTTITSHISKDGHYFIHYDPLQCRSLTVREVARLQTFPDNYFFKGNRTQQYVQVGNAVPPFLAAQIAERLWAVFKCIMI
ncbi:DNA cytosine methyltransferase [Serratia fonticola]|uniref:DNA cytosine methyltransferase n=1 Tax=Serratia fonticola TaxID=47917 RepID=UPI0016471DBF|nr:DNA cytosine methyltransferase [Serratia fonticola]MBC3216693.1 DNA cytosine methyltransferase [Serratia fonticola]